MMEKWINNLEVLTVAQNMITYIHECHSGNNDDKSDHLKGNARGSTPGHESRISGFDAGIMALLGHITIMNWEDPNSIPVLEVQALKRVKEGPAVHHQVLCCWH